jgi:hypothetical protein
MQIFLIKLINYTIENEKKFDANRKKMNNLNKYFYEYEKLSADCYAIDTAQIQGSNQQNKMTISDHSELLLFQSERNIGVRNEFE